MGKNNAKLIDPKLLIQAGINPETGLPVRLGDVKLPRECIRHQLRIVDEQDAINSFQWYNLPPGLNSQLMERILYYRGQAALFKLKDKFFFLPYTLTSENSKGTGIDVYGRFTEITPLPFNGTSGDGSKERPWIQGLVYKPVYEALLPSEIEELSEIQLEELDEKSCVIFKDYTPQYSETIVSRQIIDDPLLDIMSDCLPFLRTALLNSTGVAGMRVENQNDYTSVYQASAAVNQAAQTGQKWVPITGQVDFQELTTGQTLKSEEFLIAMQAMDNYRLSLHGLDNGGLFQKKSHMLEAEQQMNEGTTGLVLRDRLQSRQMGCIIANTIWGLGMWCEPSAPVLGIPQINPTVTPNSDVVETDEELTETEEVTDVQ